MLTFVILLVEAASLNVSQLATSIFPFTNLQCYSIVTSPLLEESIPMGRGKTSSQDPMAQAQS